MCVSDQSYNILSAIVLLVKFTFVHIHIGDKYEVVTETVTEDSQGVITPTGNTRTYIAQFVAIATGHHAKPSYPYFPGLDKFEGQFWGIDIWIFDHATLLRLY